MMVCTDEDGKLYVHDGANYRNVWREGRSCYTKGDGDVIHTAPFDSPYHAAMFMKMLEYEAEDHPGPTEFTTRMHFNFSTELWSPETSPKCYYYVLNQLGYPKWYATMDQLMFTDKYDNEFIEYVVRSLEEVYEVVRIGDIVMYPKCALLALLKGRIAVKNECQRRVEAT